MCLTIAAMVSHRVACAGLLAIFMAAAPTGAARLNIEAVSSTYRTMTVFHEHGYSYWQMSDYRTSVAFSGRDMGTSWSIEFNHVEPWGDLRWGDRRSAGGAGDGSRLAGRVAFLERTVGVNLSGDFLQRAVGASFDWHQSESGVVGYSAAVRFRPFRAIDIGLSRSRGNPAPSHSELFYSYTGPDGSRNQEGGRLFWSLPVWSTVVDIRLCPIDGLVVRSWSRESDFTPATPRDGEEPRGFYSAAVDGYGSESLLEATYRFNANWSITGQVQQGRLDARLRSYDGGAQFAYFGIVEGEGRQASVEVQHGSVRIGFRDGYLSGRIQGVIEAWPFADGLLRFLGERRHVIGEGRVDWRWAAVDATVLDRNRWMLEVCTDVVRVRPDLHYKTWRPVALGFGIDDLRVESLDLVQADLTRIRLEPTVYFGSWALTGSISQWIPIATQKRAAASGDSGGGGTAADNSVWGGFSASVSIVTRW